MNCHLVYIAWNDGGYDASGFISAVGKDWEELKNKMMNECIVPSEILIYDTEIMEQVGWITRSDGNYKYKEPEFYKSYNNKADKGEGL